MITPCNAENGCGTLMHTGSTDTASPFAPVDSIGRSQMTDVTGSRRGGSIQIQNSAGQSRISERQTNRTAVQSSENPVSNRNDILQNGDTTSIPSQTGMIASSFPMPGTEFLPEDLPEMIPGQPDPPFSQTPVNPNYTVQNRSFPNQSPQNQPAQDQWSQSRSTEFLPEQDIPPVSSESNPGSAAGIVPPPILPDAPQFAVPLNPLMPPGYQEFISYENLQYLNGFLRTQIGKYMRVEQQVGSDSIEERYGYLIGVGINYILLQELGTGNVSTLDYYNIKFVYIYYTNPSLPQNLRR